jgi:hypothetical protein
MRRWRVAGLLLAADITLLGTGLGVAAARGAHAGPPRPSAHRPPPTSRPTPSARVGPRRTVTLPPRTAFLAGQTASVTDPAIGGKVSITVGRPSYSTTALGSYGYGPQEGLYVTFPVTVVNTAALPIVLIVTDFVVDEPGLSGRTTYDGNSEYSGSPSQLRNTEVAPGQEVSGLLTFDEPGRHGVLHWQRICSWTF